MLTERENQVLQLLAEGLSNKLIAAQLNLSDHTVKFHVLNVMGKLGASTRTEAVVEAIRRGLVPIATLKLEQENATLRARIRALESELEVHRRATN